MAMLLFLVWIYLFGHTTRMEEVFNKTIKQIKNDINLTYSKNLTELQEFLFINNLADAVYKSFSNNSLSEVPNISSKTSNIISKLVSVNPIVKLFDIIKKIWCL